jgi:5-methylcytosine-specific restriction endonuclease McrA
MKATVINITKLRELVSQVSTLSALKRLACLGQRRLLQIIEEHKIDISHFKRGASTCQRPIESYLSNEYPIGSDSLRRRLIKEGLKQRVCERCDEREWLGEPIPLELHHVDGDHSNNVLTNLQILCRNCHGLAGNHKGAARPRRKAVRVDRSDYVKTIPLYPNAYEVCKALGLTCKSGNYETIYGIMTKENLSFKSVEDQEIRPDLTGLYMQSEESPQREPPKVKRRTAEPRKHGTRADAALARRKVVWPTTETLQSQVWEKPVEALAIDYGVKGNAIRHWAKRLHVTLPPASYWFRRGLGYSHEEALVSQRKTRKPLRRPTEEQAQQAYKILQDRGSMREASEAIGFDHGTTKVAFIRFGLIPVGWTGKRGRKAALSGPIL